MEGCQSVGVCFFMSFWGDGLGRAYRLVRSRHMADAGEGGRVLQFGPWAARWAGLMLGVVYATSVSASP